MTTLPTVGDRVRIIQDRIGSGFAGAKGIVVEIVTAWATAPLIKVRIDGWPVAYSFDMEELELETEDVQQS